MYISFPFFTFLRFPLSFLSFFLSFPFCFSFFYVIFFFFFLQGLIICSEHFVQVSNNPIKNCSIFLELDTWKFRAQFGNKRLKVISESFSIIDYSSIRERRHSNSEIIEMDLCRSSYKGYNVGTNSTIR